jgi:RecQ mediated genome instability protein
VARLERPLAVQIVQAVNVGVAKRDLEEEGELGGGENEEEEKKFETKYLDPNLVKEKKKQNKDASRIMKLSLTDGLNMLEAIEYERLKSIDYFNVGQKLMLKPPIEVRRGIMFLTNANVSYLGQPITTAPPAPPSTGGTN